MLDNATGIHHEASHENSQSDGSGVRDVAVAEVAPRTDVIASMTGSTCSADTSKTMCSMMRSGLIWATPTTFSTT